MTLHAFHFDVDDIYLLALRNSLSCDYHVTSIPIQPVLPIELEHACWDVGIVGMSEERVADAIACLAVLVRAERPLVVWMPREAAHWIPALSNLGVSAFLSRSASAQELTSTIRTVAARRVFIDHRLLASTHESDLEPPRDFGLTMQQERVVTTYLRHGSRRLAAADLGVSENTVKYHLRSIYTKTGASNLHELQQLFCGASVRRVHAEGHG